MTLTLADIQTWIDAGLAAYAEGGADWQLQSGVKVGTSYAQLDQAESPTRLVYAWIETTAPAAGEPHSRTGYERRVTIYARGRIVSSSPATLEHDILALTEDLERALVLGSADPTSLVHGQIQLAASAPIRVTDQLAETLVGASITHYRSFGL